MWPYMFVDRRNIRGQMHSEITSESCWYYFLLLSDPTSARAKLYHMACPIIYSSLGPCR